MTGRPASTTEPTLPAWHRVRRLIVTSKRAEAAAVVLGFACLAVAASYPVIVAPGRQLPGGLGDPLLTAWTLAWDADRMLHGLRGIWDAPSFFPYRHTLLYSDHLLGVALFTAPIQWLTHNPVLAYNAAYVGSLVLSGAGMYLLARELTGRRDAALVAAVIYAFQPFRTSHIAHLQWLLTGWLPLSLWALHRYFRTWSGPFLFLAALFYLLQSLTAAYFTYFALVPLILVGLAELWRTRPPLVRFVRQALPGAVLVAAVLLPIAGAYYEVRSTLGLHRSAGEITSMSADVGDYLSAAPDLRLWAGIGSGRGEHELFLGAAAMVLAIGAVAVRRSWAVLLYAIVLASAFVLSLGPTPAAWGQSLGIPGPYGWFLHVVPGLDGLRAPARLAVVVQVAVGVLAAFGSAWLLDRCSPRWRTSALAIIVAVVAAEGWAAPVRVASFQPEGDRRDRDAYAYLASLPSGAVMELPVSAADPELEFRYQYMTLVHGHRVVNGHSGYVTPLLLWLGGGHSPFRERDRQRDAIEMLRSIGVRYLVVHRTSYEDPSLADGTIDAVRTDSRQTLAHRSFGHTTIATLAPLEMPSPPRDTRVVPASRMRPRGSHGADRLTLMFDGNRDSRWLSGRHQSGDEWLQLDLDRERDVAVVRIQLGRRSFGDYPRELAIDAIEDSGARQLFRGSVLPQFARALIADGAYPFLEIVLPPNRAHAVRLRQLGSSHGFFWSIHELELLERGTPLGEGTRAP